MPMIIIDANGKQKFIPSIRLQSSDIATALTTPGPIGSVTPGTGAFSKLQVTGQSDIVQATIKANAAQTANLVEFQGNLGAIYAFFNGTARFGLGGMATANAKLHVQSTADYVTAIFQAYAAQTAKLTEWQDSSNNVKFYMSVGGYLQPGSVQTGYRTGSTEAAIYGAADTFNSVSGNFGALVLQSRSDTGRPIIFVTGSSPGERVRIDSSGNMGIGIAAAAARLHVLTTDAVTNAVTDVLTIDHSSSGTPAANYGTGIAIKGQSSTNTTRTIGRIRTIWTTATDASRKARLILSAFDTAERDAIAIEASGAAPMIGVFSQTGTPVVQPTVSGSRGGNAALASLLTALASIGWIVDGSSA